MIWVLNSFHYEGTWFLTSCGENIFREIATGQHGSRTEIGECVSETRGGGDYIVGRVVGLDGSGEILTT